MSLDSRAQLTYFHQDGAMEHVTDYKIIVTGAPYGSIFLKQNWYQEMTMKEVAGLSYFIIKYNTCNQKNAVAYQMLTKLQKEGKRDRRS